MCVYSAVMDHFEKVPWPVVDPLPLQPAVTTVTTFDPLMFSDPLIDGKRISEWKKLIAEFNEARAAAATVDRLTNQPDCEDPKKATLVDRVLALEARLDEIARAVGV